MARYASRVIVIEKESALTAMDGLKHQAQTNERLEFLFDTTIRKINGTQVVESVEIENHINGGTSVLPVDGVVIDVGYHPDTAYLEGIVTLDDAARILVKGNGAQLQTDNAAIFAAGDIRSAAPLHLVDAIRDGELAAAGVRELLESRRD